MKNEIEQVLCRLLDYFTENKIQIKIFGVYEIDDPDSLVDYAIVSDKYADIETFAMSIEMGFRDYLGSHVCFILPQDLKKFMKGTKFELIYERG